MRISKITSIIALMIVSMLVFSASASPNASWGVQVGDSAVYWIDELYVDGANLAPILNDANRTTLVAITSIGESHLNYSLGLQNGSQIMNNQQITIAETTLQSQTIYYPNGSLPIILPLSVEGYSNYLNNLASNAALIGLVVDDFISDGNITNIKNFDFSSVYRSSFFNITAEIELQNLANFSSMLLPQLNMTDQIGFTGNQTINSASFHLNIAYNSTDGMLASINLDSALNTTQYEDNTAINQTRTFNASIVRQSYTSIDDINTSEAISRASEAAESSFLILGIAPAILIARKFNR